MAEPLIMPTTGEGVGQGTVLRWLKAEGDRVERDEVVVEVETEKVNFEIPSPWSGVIERILVGEGETVPEGQVLAYIEPEELETTREASASGAETTSAAPLPAEPTEEVRYSPAVLALAREHGVDLRRVSGSGQGGRVTRQDVLRYVAEGAAPAGDARSTVSPPPEIELLPLTPTRRTIAKRMALSARTIPHAWFAVEVDVTSLVLWRQQIRDEFRQREGVDLTYLPFAIKAAAEALKEHPLLNASWTDDGILLKKQIGIGVAVATDAGLVVPVVHQADRLSITNLARQLADLAERARTRRLSLEDVQGGTFTLDNTGAFGSVVSMPIINYPQAAIMTLEAVQQRPSVVNDTLAIRHMVNMALSFDHRVLDGAEAGAFMTRVKAKMEAYGSDAKLD